MDRDLAMSDLVKQRNKAQAEVRALQEEVKNLHLALRACQNYLDHCEHISVKPNCPGWPNIAEILKGPKPPT